MNALLDRTVAYPTDPTNQPTGLPGGRYGTILDGIAKTVNVFGQVAENVVGQAERVAQTVRNFGDNRDGRTVVGGSTPAANPTANANTYAFDPRWLWLLLAVLVAAYVYKKR